MTVDLTQFHDAFFEESFEALDAMEAALLKLDIGAPDPELINTIFRVAHSIKGGSATFGFAEIASFTHSLETLLDELRSGAMPVSEDVSDVLLKSVDVMRAMLRAVQAKQPIDAQHVSDLHFDLEVIIARITSTDFSSRSDTAAEAAMPPLRSSSSSVSRLCVNEAMSAKPNVALPPLMEWATRKMVLMSSGSGAPTSSFRSAASIASSASKLSSKNAS